MDHGDILKKARFFAGFTGDEVAAFLAAGARQRVPDGHVFLHMGSPNASLFVILGGSVKVERLGVAENVPLATLPAGETFGEMSFTDGSRTTARLSAVGPTEVLAVSRASFDALLGERPAMWGKFWHNLALELMDRLSKTNKLVDHYADVNQLLVDNPSYRESMSRV